MNVFQKTLVIRTPGRGLVNVTSSIQQVVGESGIHTGLCHVFLQHTSASLTIQENADPAVLRDLERWFSELAPETRRWEHADEGPDDMPAHARTVITQSSETIPVTAGTLNLGTWQGLYLWEHRRAAHRRKLIATVTGVQDV